MWSATTSVRLWVAPPGAVEAAPHVTDDCDLVGGRKLARRLEPHHGDGQLRPVTRRGDLDLEKLGARRQVSAPWFTRHVALEDHQV